MGTICKPILAPPREEGGEWWKCCRRKHCSQKSKKRFAEYNRQEPINPRLLRLRSFPFHSKHKYLQLLFQLWQELWCPVIDPPGRSDTNIWKTLGSIFLSKHHRKIVNILHNVYYERQFHSQRSCNSQESAQFWVKSWAISCVSVCQGICRAELVLARFPCLSWCVLTKPPALSPPTPISPQIGNQVWCFKSI